MSRTIRRKNKGHIPCWVTHDYKWNEEYDYYERVKLEDDDLQKELNRWHSDKDWHRSPSRLWRQDHHQRFRAQARQEIIKYLKNEEYEVQIRNNPRWPWWD